MFAPHGHYQPFWIWPAAMGNALIELSAVVAPSREYILEVRRYQQVEADDRWHTLN